MGSPGRFIRDIAGARHRHALRFLASRGRRPGPNAPLDIDRIAWAAPVAGVAVGLVGALVLALAALLGLPLLLRAAFATAALVAATGALHEDGLADVADGFGGGATRARKLEIMRDSSIGAYGAIAIALALILRVGALAAALDGGFWRAAFSLTLVAALSRAAALTPLALLPPARADGAGAAAGRLDRALAGRLGLGPVCRRARPRRAWAHALLAALMSGPGFVHGRAGARRDRRTDRRRRRRSRNSAARSPPGADFSSGIRPL
jgi:adenosylcobinamide-GDP ribazoletransferase